MKQITGWLVNVINLLFALPRPQKDNGEPEPATCPPQEYTERPEFRTSKPLAAGAKTVEVLQISITHEESDQIGHEINAVLACNRFQPDAHAKEMMTLAGDILRSHLLPAEVEKLRHFGDSKKAPVVFVEGFPKLEPIPQTPFRGYNLDESTVAFADMLLLGIYDLSGIEPVAFSYENFGKLFRNVVPNPDSKGQQSSHGFDADLIYHTDNPCGPFESDQMSMVSGNRSPIPRFLGFTPLRNRDGKGTPVPTEVLLIDQVLSRLEDKAIVALSEPEFQVNPPPSNNTIGMTEVPLLVRCNGRQYVRFNSEPAEVFGLTDKARWGMEKLKMAIREAEREVLAFNLEPSMVLVFDNYRVLHRRHTFDPGSDLGVTRWLRRCYACHSLHNGTFVDRHHYPNLWQ
jgi:L-asparagine oxygenase